MKKHEFIFLQLSPFYLSKNNSIQANISNSFSPIKAKNNKEIQSNSNKKDTLNNTTHYNKINNYYNFLNSPREQSNEFLRKKITSAEYRINYRHGILNKNKTSFHLLKYRPKRLINFTNLKSFRGKNKIKNSQGIFDTEKLSFTTQKNDKTKKSANNLFYSDKKNINFEIINSENTFNNQNNNIIF